MSNWPPPPTGKTTVKKVSLTKVNAHIIWCQSNYLGRDEEDLLIWSLAKLPSFLVTTIDLVRRVWYNLLIFWFYVIKYISFGVWWTTGSLVWLVIKLIQLQLFFYLIWPWTNFNSIQFKKDRKKWRLDFDFLVKSALSHLTFIVKFSLLFDKLPCYENFAYFKKKKCGKSSNNAESL